MIVKFLQCSLIKQAQFVLWLASVDINLITVALLLNMCTECLSRLSSDILRVTREEEWPKILPYVVEKSATEKEMFCWLLPNWARKDMTCELEKWSNIWRGGKESDFEWRLFFLSGCWEVLNIRIASDGSEIGHRWVTSDDVESCNSRPDVGGHIGHWKGLDQR